MANKKILSAVIDFAGSIDPSLGKVIDEATKKLEGINWKAVAVGAAIGGIAVATGKAVVEAGKYLKELGSQFDSVADAIRIGTGATGDALDDLLDDFDEVYKSIPTSMDDAAKAIADYNTRLGLTGTVLQEISKQAIQVSDMLGEDLGNVIEESSQAFQAWQLDAEEMSGAMDYVYKVSQATGIGFTDLLNKTQKFAPQLQEMGYSFETATALIGQLEKAGVNTDEVLAAMKKSVGALAKEGISASEGLAMYYEQILNAGDAAKATAIANEIFGARAGSTIASAIRNGTLAVGDFTAELLANDETIAGAAEDTYDFAERLQVMRQELEVALKPIANTVFDGLNKFMPTLQKLMRKFIPLIEDAVESAMPFVEEFLAGAADLLEELLPMIIGLGESLLPILSTLVMQLLPPLLDLAMALLPPLMQIVEAILPPVMSILTAILPMITEIASAILPIIAELIAQLLPIVTPLLEMFLSLLNDVVMPLLPALTSLLEVILPPLIQLFGAIAPALQPIADVLGSIVGFIAKVVEWVAQGLGWVVSLITGEAKVEVAEIPGYATGGFTDGLSIVGEDPRYPTEAVISFNPAYRAQNLAYWAKAGRMLGVDDGILSLLAGSTSYVVYDFGGIVFSPRIEVYGDVDEDEIIKKIKEHEPEFFDYLEKWLRKREAGCYGAAYSRVH